MRDPAATACAMVARGLSRALPLLFSSSRYYDVAHDTMHFRRS